MKSDREVARETCEMVGHVWRETYYGDECENCGEFYPFGCAPWDEDETELYELGYLP